MIPPMPMMIVPEGGWDGIDKHAFIRVRNEGNRNVDDKENWMRLMRHFEKDVDLPETFHYGGDGGRRTGKRYYLIVMVLLLVLWVYYIFRKMDFLVLRA